MINCAFRRTALPCAAACLSLILNLSPRSAKAQPIAATVPEVVISANRLEGTVGDIASSVSVIDSETIEQSGATTVPQVLRTQPGIDVVQSGSQGGNVAVFLRGANSEHTLVMVDGILMNNPVTPTRAFDLANIPLDLVDRIEILRGPQSSLYGSDALGGVINIITKRGQGAPTSSVLMEGGSFGTNRALASVAGGGDTTDYSLAVSRFHTDGVSAASKWDGNREKDGNEILGIAGQFGFKPSDAFSMRGTLRVSESETEIDTVGGVGGDDPNRVVDNRTIAAGLVAEGTMADGMIRPIVGFTLSDHSLDDKNDPDSLNPNDSLRSSYNGTLMKGYGTLQFEPHEKVSALIGYETIREVAESTYRSISAFGPYDEDVPEKSARTNGGFVQVRTRPMEGLVIEGSGRIDDNQRFDQRATWRFAPQYTIQETGTRFHATIGTGYKAPSLYEIFSQYGDMSLRPERSTGWDAGVEQFFFDKALSLEAIYFNNKLSNLISFDPGTFQFQNIGRARTKGVELVSRLSLCDTVQVGTSYTYTDPTDEVTGERLLRRARNKADFTTSYRMGKRYTITGGYTVFGRRADVDYSSGSPTRVFLGSYGLVRIGLEVQVTDRFQIHARVDNLLDKKYEEVRGYGTFGIGGYAGVRYAFG